MINSLERAKPIRLLILDVDGILTTGTIYFDNGGIEVKGFHALDGIGLKLLQKYGIHIAILSGKLSKAVEMRTKELGIADVFLGQDEKLPVYQNLKNKWQLNDNEIAYMGDDLPDLPMMRRVGLAVTVPHAPDIIQEHAHMTTRRPGGEGAVREVCELILKAQGHYQTMLDSFLK